MAMKINKLGETHYHPDDGMLHDGYCLSTIHHGTELAQSGNYGFTDVNDSPSTRWLTEHIKYCEQCWQANRYKVMFGDYLEAIDKDVARRWITGQEFPQEEFKGFMTGLLSREPSFWHTMTMILNHNLSSQQEQAAANFSLFKKSLEDDPLAAHDPITDLDTRVIQTDTRLIFDIWRLIDRPGHEKYYSKEKMQKSWEDRTIKLPGVSNYFYFSELINDHLLKCAAVKTEAEFGLLSVQGVWVAMVEGQPTMRLHYSKRGNVNLRKGYQSNLLKNSYLWAAIIVAILDVDHFIDKGVMKKDDGT